MDLLMASSYGCDVPSHSCHAYGSVDVGGFGSNTKNADFLPDYSVLGNQQAPIAIEEEEQTDFQDVVRQQVADVLWNPALSISLASFSLMTGYSTTVLSMWWRDIYKGNNEEICYAMSMALQTLEDVDTHLPPLSHKATALQ